MGTQVEYQSNISVINRIICGKYWLSDTDDFVHTVKEISQNFGIKAHEVTQIAQKNAYLIVYGYQCIDCNKTNHSHTRNEFKQLKLGDWRCAQCRKIYDEKRCREFKQFSLERNRLRERYRKVVIKALEHHEVSQMANIPCLDKLNTVDSLLLVATIESLGSKALTTTKPLCSDPTLPLTPTISMDKKILKHLFELNLLLLNPEENYHWVDINKDGHLEINYYRATFKLAHDAGSLMQLTMKVRSNQKQSRLIEDIKFRQWCQDIQLAECENHLFDQITLEHLILNVDEKMLYLFQSGLASYSVADMCRIITKAAKILDTALLNLSTTKIQALTVFYKSMESNLNKLRDGRWQRRTYKHDIFDPQSAISKVLFKYGLGIKDFGFNYTLNEMFDLNNDQN